MKAPLQVRGTRHPVMYELDVRSWLARLTVRFGRRVKLGNIPRVEIESLLSTGADLVWLMGVWRTGPAGRRVSRTKPGLADEAAAILPDFSPGDIVGSPYAVAAYEVAPVLGGEVGLATFRQQLAARGAGIVLDFVPNHTAMDHPWVRRHPDWYAQASRDIVDADRNDQRSLRRLAVGWPSPFLPACGRESRRGHGALFPASRDSRLRRPRYRLRGSAWRCPLRARRERPPGAGSVPGDAGRWLPPVPHSRPRTSGARRVELIHLYAGKAGSPGWRSHRRPPLSTR